MGDPENRTSDERSTSNAIAMQLQMEEVLLAHESGLMVPPEHLRYGGDTSEDEDIALHLQLTDMHHQVSAMAMAEGAPFECPICMEKKSIEDAFTISCGHKLCRPCTRQFVIGEVQ